MNKTKQRSEIDPTAISAISAIPQKGSQNSDNRTTSQIKGLESKIKYVSSEKQENLQRRSLLTIDQLAEKLQVPRSWIYERTRINSIPYKKLGKYLRFNELEIDDWIQSNCSLKFKLDEKCRS